jgi:hypothetical protein
LIKHLLPSLTIGLLTGIGSAQSQPAKNLNIVGHGTSLLFVTRGNVCETGQIVRIDQTSVEIRNLQKQSMRLKLSDLVMIGENLDSHNLVYSGESSWDDVLNSRPAPHKETLLIETKAGKSYRVDPMKVTDQQIEFKGLHDNEVLTKSEIATVDYLRMAPISDDTEYLIQETVLIAPSVWWAYLGLGRRINVRLYDASLPERETKRVCPKS